MIGRGALAMIAGVYFAWHGAASAQAESLPDEVAEFAREKWGAEAVATLNASFDPEAGVAIVDDPRVGLVSICCVPRASVGEHSDADSLRQSEAELRAIGAATLRVALRRFDRSRFPRSDLLVKAVRDCGYRLAGDAAPGLSTTRFQGRMWIGFAAWIASGGITLVTAKLPTEAEIERAYAKRLKEAARAALERGDGARCLALAREVQALRRDSIDYFDASLVVDIADALRITKSPEAAAKESVRALLEKWADWLSVPLGPEDAARLVRLARWTDIRAGVDVQESVLRRAVGDCHARRDWIAVVRFGRELRESGVATTEGSLQLCEAWIELGERELPRAEVERVLTEGADLSREEWIFAGHLAHRLSLFELGSRACDRAFQTARRGER